MSKRTLILLCLAGGMLIGTAVPSASHARNEVLLVWDDSSEIDQATAQQVLKIAAPQMGISYAEAWTAYSKDEISIVEVPYSGNGRMFHVADDTDTIWTIIIDDL